MASAAFTMRLRRSCSSCPTSIRVVQRSSARQQVDLHALRDRPSQHRPQLADDGIELYVLGVDRAAVREREELTCERSAAFRRETDLHDVIAHLTPRGQRVLDELRIVHDDREDVVEIVGDPTREPTDALEPLRLSEPLLEREPVLVRCAPRAQVTDERGEDVTARVSRPR